MAGSKGRVRLNPPASVYVVELSPQAARRGEDRRRAALGAPVVYVGQSALSPNVRFEHHLQGGMHTSSDVRKYGRGVLWSEGPFHDRGMAERQERRLAKLLRKSGAVVLGGH